MSKAANLAIEYRWADGDFARLPGLAAELVRRNVEIITTTGSPESAKAAMQATATIPIVGTSVAPLVEHFNRPEGNVTGVSILTGDLTPKRLQLLAEIVPGATIGVLMNPNYPAHDRDRKTIEDAARALGVRLASASASADPDFEPAFASLARQQIGALLPEAEPFLGSRWQLLVTLAAKRAVPMMH
jgi:putative ABC transport system substrate-binding protein